MYIYSIREEILIKIKETKHFKMQPERRRKTWRYVLWGVKRISTTVPECKLEGKKREMDLSRQRSMEW